MKIGFVVNDVATEKDIYTTTRLAMTAHAMGHEAYYMGLGDFAYQPDGSLAAAPARRTSRSPDTSRTSRSPRSRSGCRSTTSTSS